MPFVLRGVRQNRWIVDSNDHLELWLGTGDFPADPLADLLTDKNKLSVYRIEDNQSNLERVIVALAATRANLSNYDYILLDISVLSRINVKYNFVAGTTPDSEVNTWHIDLIELSASKLFDLAEVVWNERKIGRKLPKDLMKWTTNSILQGYLDRTKIKTKEILEWLKSLPNDSQ